MIKLDDKALKYAQKKEGSFVVKTLSTSSGWCSSQIKSLWIEVLKNFSKNDDYLCYEYEGVKIFIEKELDISENILIYQKIKLPVLGSIFAAKGISIKYM